MEGKAGVNSGDSDRIQNVIQNMIHTSKYYYHGHSFPPLPKKFTTLCSSVQNCQCKTVKKQLKHRTLKNWSVLNWPCFFIFLFLQNHQASIGTHIILYFETSAIFVGVLRGQDVRMGWVNCFRTKSKYRRYLLHCIEGLTTSQSVGPGHWEMWFFTSRSHICA